MQDWQKQVLKMTKGQELASVFKVKKTNKNKNKNNNKMRSREYVSFYLGDTDRLISTYVLVEADKGDYDNPPSADYYIDDEYYDENDGVVTDLVERYASIYKFDLEDAAIDAIQDNY